MIIEPVLPCTQAPQMSRDGRPFLAWGCLGNLGLAQFRNRPCTADNMHKKSWRFALEFRRLGPTVIRQHPGGRKLINVQILSSATLAALLTSNTAAVSPGVAAGAAIPLASDVQAWRLSISASHGRLSGSVQLCVSTRYIVQSSLLEPPNGTVEPAVSLNLL